MPRDIVFVHIPKTAGTSLRHALRQARPDLMHLYDYGAAEPLTSPIVRDLRYGQPSSINHLRKHLPANKSVLLMGHFEASVYSDIFAADSFVTFVRQPVQRVISDYKHHVRHYGYSRSLIEFARDPAQRNKQSSYLSGMDVDTLGFIGISEDFATEVQRLSEFTGISLAPPLINEAPKEQSVEITPDVEEEILSLNESDWVLYQCAVLARSRFPKKKPLWGPVRGRASSLPGNKIKGWAIAEQGRRIVTFEMFHSGRKVGSVECDIYRPDLVSQETCPTGIGGFLVDPADFGISAGDIILRHPKLELSITLSVTSDLATQFGT